MEEIIRIIHVIVAVILVGLVLVQHGKGADVGAAFGSGSSNTMFGSQGAMPFLMKITSLLAAIFFATNLSLSYISGHQMRPARAANTSVPASTTLTVPTAKQKKQQQQIVFPSMNQPSQGSDGEK